MDETSDNVVIKGIGLSPGARESRILDAKIAFNIGWDYRAHRMFLPSMLNKDEFNMMMVGFIAAKKSDIKPKPFDIYTKKWLQLRINAWRRDKLFSDNVTPEFLKKLSVERCPITNIHLTHGTGGMSDWSVDRINNNAAYGVGNLIIVSNLANREKRDLLPAQIADIALGISPVPPPATVRSRGLTMMEWMRWHCVCSSVVVERNGGTSYTIAPAVVLPSHCVPASTPMIMQYDIAWAAYGDARRYRELISVLNIQHRKTMNDVMRRAQKIYRKMRQAETLSNPIDIWFNVALFNRFKVAFAGIMSDENQLDLLDLQLSNMDCKKFDIDFNEWGVESGGYVDRRVPEDIKDDA